MTDGTRQERDDLVQRLVRLADQGPDIPPDGAERLRAQMRPVWEREVRSRKIRQAAYWTGGALALAAAIAIVLLAPPLRRQPPPLSIAPAAFIEVVSGSVEIDPPGEAPRIESSATERGIETGSGLRTGPSDRAAIRLLDGAIVRIDVESALRLPAAGVIELDSGGVYVDSARGGPVEVRTPLGSARDIGTQFEVRSETATLTVKVRRGAVAVQPRTGPPMTIESGTAVSLGANGSRSTALLGATSSEWTWTVAVASTPEIEGMSVADLLDWISSETGVAIRYENAETERFARSTVLHGSLGRLRPEQIAATVLPGAGLQAEERGDALLIRRAP